MKIKFLIPFLFYSAMSFAQDHSQRLDSLFNSLYNYGQFNGNVLVAENGLPIYKKSFGYLNFETRKLHNENSIFSLASISKTFTSLTILQLKQKGKLKLDNCVKEYLEDFPYKDITIRNLLTHTSGLPDLDIYEEAVTKNPKRVFTNKDVLSLLKAWKKPLSYKPYEKWNYSNINYELLVLIVEQITKIEFQKYVRENIFIPAKMTNTYFKTDKAALNNKNISINYEYPSEFASNMIDVDRMKKYRWSVFSLSGLVGDGNVFSTTEDLCKFDQALYSGELIESSILEEAFTPTKLKSGINADAAIGIGKASYGLGWFIFDDDTNGKIVWHTGGDPGVMTILLRNIDKKQTVILLDNAGNEAVYKNGVNAMSILNNKPMVSTKQSLTRIYGSTLVDKGIDAAFTKLIELREDTTHYRLRENDMNDLGYNFLYHEKFKGHNELALEVFKQNILLFPNSYNPYDSYGEVLAKLGKKDEAIYMYSKSIKLNPDNEGGKKALEKLLKQK